MDSAIFNSRVASSKICALTINHRTLLAATKILSDSIYEETELYLATENQLSILCFVPNFSGCIFARPVSSPSRSLQSRSRHGAINFY